MTEPVDPPPAPPTETQPSEGSPPEARPAEAHPTEARVGGWVDDETTPAEDAEDGPDGPDDTAGRDGAGEGDGDAIGTTRDDATAFMTSTGFAASMASMATPASMGIDDDGDMDGGEGRGEDDEAGDAEADPATPPADSFATAAEATATTLPEPAHAAPATPETASQAGVAVDPTVAAILADLRATGERAPRAFAPIFILSLLLILSVATNLYMSRTVGGLYREYEERHGLLNRELADLRRRAEALATLEGRREDLAETLERRGDMIRHFQVQVQALEEQLATLRAERPSPAATDQAQRFEEAVAAERKKMAKLVAERNKILAEQLTLTKSLESWQGVEENLKLLRQRLDESLAALKQARRQAAIQAGRADHLEKRLRALERTPAPPTTGAPLAPLAPPPAR